MKQNKSWVQRKNGLLLELKQIWRAARIATAQPLAPACIEQEETIEAETSEDRALLVLDEMHGGMVFALLRSTDDIDALLNYIQFAANVVRQEQADPVPAVVSSALTQPGVTVHWSIHPDVYFAAQKQTL